MPRWMREANDVWRGLEGLILGEIPSPLAALRSSNADVTRIRAGGSSWRDADVGPTTS
jgi:hypothetical protein